MISYSVEVLPKMVNLHTKIDFFHGKMSRNVLFSSKTFKIVLFSWEFQQQKLSWEIITNGNITMASIVKIPFPLRYAFFHALTQTIHLVIEKFPSNVEISMTIANSVVCGLPNLPLHGTYYGNHRLVIPHLCLSSKMNIL
jgi:hypothetical protein